ncbi:MAG: cysteine--tRNA ligase [Gammaproteobacteria bacterium]|nr:cysteine--tRNA ligase [Gammaproteobacteria bacterium]
MLKLYNGLTRKKETFEPLKAGQVSLYICGITVYDRCHMGHARYLVGFDMIVRFLRASGYQVKFVRNITDIDDKIIVRAASLGVPIQTLTEQSIQAMYEDTAALGLLSPDREPKATDYIEPIIQLIQRLMTKGLAYVSDDGDVCFEVSKFKPYGQLSQQDLDGLMAGARVEVVASKRSPLDFVLWKKAKPDEPFWASPWGDGRPGWHIECSAMSMGELGETMDIHGGGIDLQFPHHENELAQSEGATGHCFAKYWMHSGLLQINREKMAKSTGNFLTIEAVLKQYSGEVLRCFFLSSQYRSALNYSDDALNQALKSLTRLYQALKGHDVLDVPLQQAWVDRFFAVMNDDFNTPEALSVLFDLSHELNKTQDPSLAATLKHLGGLLGLLQDDPNMFLQSGQNLLDHAQIEQKIAEREAARQAKDFKRADDVRQWLLDKGVVLEDSPAGTTWRHCQ